MHPFLCRGESGLPFLELRNPLKVMAIKRKVKKVHIHDSGENSLDRFQNFDISGGYLVHQYQGP